MPFSRRVRIGRLSAACVVLPAGAAVVFRTCNSRRSSCDRGSPPASASRSRSAPCAPLASSGCATVVQPAVAGQLDVVEADDRQPLGHVDAGSRRRVDHASAWWSDAAKIAVGGAPSREQLVGGRARRVAAVRAGADELPAHGDAGALERGLVAAPPRLARGEPERAALRVAEEGDALVAELEQVLGGEAAAADVVGVDAGSALRLAVDEHDGDARGPQPLELLRRSGGGETTSSPSTRPLPASERKAAVACSGRSTSNSVTW